MKKLLAIALVASGLVFASAHDSKAGVSVGIGVGIPAPYPAYPYYYYGGVPYPYAYGVWRGPGWYWSHGHRTWYAHRWGGHPHHWH